MKGPSWRKQQDFQRKTGKSSVPDGSIGEGSFSSAFSWSNDESCSLGRTDSLISWREKDEGFLEDVYKPLCMLSGEDMAVEAPENQPKVAKIATLKESGEEGASGFESPSRGLSEGESLSDLSYQKFISFSKFMVLPVNENEKEITSLLKKLESRKQHRASIVKRRAPSTSRLVRELQIFECSANYCSSNKKEKNQSKGWELVCK